MNNQKIKMPLGLVVLGLMACSELELSGVTDFENSVAKNSSSSAANDFHVIDQPVKHDLWAFNDFLADSGNTNSGYWFDFVGTEEGNSSTIEFPVQKGGQPGNFFRKCFDLCVCFLFRCYGLIAACLLYAFDLPLEGAILFLQIDIFVRQGIDF